MTSEIVPHDPVANALELLKKLPDKITFEIDESYTCGLESYTIVNQRLGALYQLDRACEEAGYTVRISRAPDHGGHRYDLERKPRPQTRQALPDDTIEI